MGERMGITHQGTQGICNHLCLCQKKLFQRRNFRKWTVLQRSPLAQLRINLSIRKMLKYFKNLIIIIHCSQAVSKVSPNPEGKMRTFELWVSAGHSGLEEILQPAGEAIAMENPTSRGFHSQTRTHTPNEHKHLISKFIFVNGEKKKSKKKK